MLVFFGASKKSSKNHQNAGEIQGDLPEIMVNPSKIMVNNSDLP